MQYGFMPSPAQKNQLEDWLLLVEGVSKEHARGVPSAILLEQD
jgi:hypothetical protein